MTNAPYAVTDVPEPEARTPRYWLVLCWTLIAGALILALPLVWWCGG